MVNFLQLITPAVDLVKIDIHICSYFKTVLSDILRC